VNLYGLYGCPAVRQCAAVQQCAAVRAVVCGSSVYGGVRTVRAAVCDSALGILNGSARCSVRLYGSATVCYSVRQFAAVCSSADGSVRAARVAVCGSVWQCAW
jgi:hypothetical protein